ncbi:YcgN family cysteine cluster protein [Ectothiorhodospira lacustris]|uniref:YcgN family cysteine cluster protein n=1 Tax=Ectothiorhodospira lacustris TaxID=2899127 RepID=UPI003D3183D0
MLKPGFWEGRPLADLDDHEWEALCDGCGRCCLHKLQDEDTDEIYYTDVACRLLDPQSCRCSRYEDRLSQVPDCVRLTPAEVTQVAWLPPTCAYRRLHEGRGLPSWHPLLTGDPESVHRAGVSVQGRILCEQRMRDDWQTRIVIWPCQDGPG